MDKATVIAMVSIITAGLTITLGTMIPAIAEMKVMMKSMDSIAQQPDASGVISRNLFVGLAMIESLAIYCLVISIIMIFTNPFWDYVKAAGG